MYILDTNTYSALSKNEPAVVRVVRGERVLGIALPAIAELRYGFVHGDRPEQNEKRLQEFLAQPNIQLIMPTLGTTNHYAEIQQYCKSHGRSLSQNDVWIAALTRESGQTLLTFDKDFAALAGLLDGRVCLLEHV